MSNQFPAGSYDAVCTGDVQYGTTSNGNDQVGIGLEVHGPEGFEAFMCTAILYFSPNSKQMSIDKLKACGWNGSGDIGEQIKGKPCRIGVKYEEYNGEQKMKVNIYDRSPGIKFDKPMDAAAKTRFLTSLSAAAGGPTKAADNGYPPGWDVDPIGPPQQQAPKGRLSLGNK